jgi:hypothetical protein
MRTVQAHTVGSDEGNRSRLVQNVHVRKPLRPYATPVEVCGAGPRESLDERMELSDAQNGPAKQVGNYEVA